MNYSASEQNALFFCSERQPEFQATCAINSVLSEAGKGCTGEIYSYPIASIEPHFDKFSYRSCRYEELKFKNSPKRQGKNKKYLFIVPYFSVSDSKQWLTGVYDALSSLASVEEKFFFEIIATNKNVHIQFACGKKNVHEIQKAFHARFPSCEFDIQENDSLLECLENANTDSMHIEALYPRRPYYRNLFAPISKFTSVLNQFLSSASVLEDGDVFCYRLCIEKAKSPWELNSQNLHSFEHKVLTLYSDANMVEDWQFSPYSESVKAISAKIHPESTPYFFAQPMIVFFGKREKFGTLKSFISGFRFGDNLYNSATEEQFISKLGSNKFIDSFKARHVFMQGHFLNRLELACFITFPCENCHEIKDNHLNIAVGKPIDKEFQSGLIIGRKKQGSANVNLCLPIKHVENSLAMIGNMGFGKSNLLLNLLSQLSEMSEPKYSIILFYFHEFDFVADFVSRIPDERLNDVILAMPSLEGKVLRHNVVDRHAVKDVSLKAADLAYAFETGSTGFGIDVKFVIKNLFQILLLADDVALSDIFEVVRCKSEKGRKIRKQAYERTKNPLLREYIDILNEKGEDEKKILNKFQQLFDTEDTALMSHYVGKDTIDYHDIVENKKILIWYLGGLNAAGDMVASVATSLIHHHFLSYGNTRPKPYFPTVTVIDEAQRIKARGIVEAVREDRKHGFSLFSSTQTMQNVDSSYVEAINLTPNLIVFQCPENDAKNFSQRAAGIITPKEIASFRKYELAARLNSARHVYSCVPDKFVKGDPQKIEFVIKNSIKNYYTDAPKNKDSSVQMKNKPILDAMPESIKKIVNRKPSTKRS